MCVYVGVCVCVESALTMAFSQAPFNAILCPMNTTPVQLQKINLQFHLHFQLSGHKRACWCCCQAIT